MEVCGFVLDAAQAVAQLAGVVKRHVAYHELHRLASAMEKKAVRAYSVANQLSALAELDGIGAQLFSLTLRDLQFIREELTAVESKSIGNILQAPVLGNTLREIDTKLTQIDQFFRTVGVLGALISTQRSDVNRGFYELRELILDTLSAVLSTLIERDERLKLLLELESRVRTRASFSQSEIVSKNEADFTFAMGLTEYGVNPGMSGVVFRNLDPVKLRSAARHFQKACNLGKREAFRFLGDLYYYGRGVECCYQTAAILYQEGVTRSDPAAMFELGWCYELGHGVEPNMGKAIKLHGDSVEGGFGEAMYCLGFKKLHGKNMSCNYSEAVRLLKNAEKRDVFMAKELLGWCFERGIGMQHDPKKAFELFRESVDGGNFWATSDAARGYDTGTGVEPDLYEATKVYEKCMRAGSYHWDYYKAYYGLRLIHGLGVEKNESKGKALIIDATNDVVAIGWHALGECYRHGHGFNKDPAKAIEYYMRAISCAVSVHGIMGSYLALGEMFEAGEGVVANSHRAMKYFLCAAERLDPTAQWKVASAFEAGIGEQKDLNRAVYFFRMCANSGNKHAQRKAVTYYMKGHGLERSRVHARRMIEEAAKEGNREARRWVRREKRRDLARTIAYHIRGWSF